MEFVGVHVLETVVGLIEYTVGAGMMHVVGAVGARKFLRKFLRGISESRHDAHSRIMNLKLSQVCQI